jgi:hypothetical protein
VIQATNTESSCPANLKGNSILYLYVTVDRNHFTPIWYDGAKDGYKKAFSTTENSNDLHYFQEGALDYDTTV